MRKISSNTFIYCLSLISNLSTIIYTAKKEIPKDTYSEDVLCQYDKLSFECFLLTNLRSIMIYLKITWIVVYTYTLRS